MQGQNRGKFGAEHSKSKAVLAYKEDIQVKEYGSLTEAATDLETYPTDILRACRNQDKLIKGFRLAYKVENIQVNKKGTKRDYMPSEWQNQFLPAELDDLDYMQN